MYNIKTNIIPFLVALYLMPVMLHAQKPDGYTMTGHIKGLKEGDKVLLTMMEDLPGEAVELHADSPAVKNGEFKLQGHVPGGPRVYWLRFPRTDRVYRMFIDNGQDI